MVETARTINYLLTQEQQDGQSPGAFTLQRVRDLTATMALRTNNVRITSPEYGAIGDGSSHPASSKYNTLTDLQAVYGTTIGGVTVALTQELDWLAAAYAINTISHGNVIFPVGTFVFSNSNSAADGSGQILFPQADYGSTAKNLIGEPGAVLTWPSDLGTGKFAIRGAGTNRTGRCYGLISGLTLSGPGCGATLGASTCNMQGIGTSDARQLKDINIIGFWSGVNVVGGQCSHIDVRTFGCYYGYYWDNPDSFNFGNMLLQGVKCDGNLMAGIGVHHAASIISCKFTNLFAGTAPYSVFKETNNGAPGQVQIFHNCILENFQFENFGNAAISDDRASGSHMTNCFGTTFRNGQYLWDDTAGQSHQIASTTKYAVFDIAQFFDCTIDGIVETQALLPGTLSIFQLINGDTNFLIRGDIGQLITNCTGASSPHNGLMFALGVSNVFVEDKTGWKGTLYFDTVGVTVGQVVTDGGAVSAGTASDIVAGISMYAPGTFKLGLVAYSGEVTVKATGTIAAGAYVRTASGGAVQAATDWSDVTSVRVGRCTSAASGGFCKVRLMGLV